MNFPENPYKDDPEPTIRVRDVEYTDHDRVYMIVNDIFDVKLVRTPEGLVVDIFPVGVDCDPIASTYAYDNECVDEDGQPYADNYA